LYIAKTPQKIPINPNNKKGNGAKKHQYVPEVIANNANNIVIKLKLK
jgi:hypothetical protein